MASEAIYSLFLPRSLTMQFTAPLRKTAPMLALISTVALLLVPSAAASPITATLAWSSQNLVAGQSTTATASVSIDSDCPSGQTYSGTITVVEPDGVSTATFSVGTTPCGTSVTAVYPTDFTGVAGTTQTGTYSATWAGSSSAVVGGSHPSFILRDNFAVHAFSPPPVPQFPMGIGLLIVVAVPLLLALKNRRSAITNQ